MVAPSYLPSFRYYIDLDGDGDFDESIEEITNYVISSNWSIGMSEPYQTLADEARAVIELNNSDRRFSPENPSSPLNTSPFKLLPERRIKIAGGDVLVIDNDGEYVVDNNGETLEIDVYQVVVSNAGQEVQDVNGTEVLIEADNNDLPFYVGYIELIQPEFNRYGERVATIEATSLKRRLQQGEIMFPLLRTATSNNIIERVHERILPSLDFSYDDVGEGVLTYEEVGNNFDDRTDGYSILNEVAEAEQGWLWYNRDGNPSFRPASYKQEKIAVDQVFSDLDAQALNVIPNAKYWNDIDVSPVDVAVKVPYISRYGNMVMRVTTSASLTAGGYFGRDNSAVIDDIPVTNGETYTMSFWVRGVSNYTGITMEYQIRNQANTSLGNFGQYVLTEDWTRYDKTFTVAPPTTHVFLDTHKFGSTAIVEYEIAGVTIVSGSVANTRFDDGSVLHDDEQHVTSMEYQFGQDIRNKVQVTYYIPEIDEELSTVWDKRRDFIIKPGQSVTIKAKFKSADGQRLGAYSPILPNSSDGSLTFKKGSATATLVEENVQQMTFTLTNDSATRRCIVNRVFIQAYEIKSWSPQLVISQDDDSVTTYGENTLDFDLQLVSNEDRAAAIADHYLLQRSQPNGIVNSITLYNRDIYTYDILINRLGIGSRITVKEYQTETLGDYFIVGEQHDVSSTAHEYTVTYFLEPVPRYNGWIVGYPGRSEVGTTMVIGL